MLFQIGPIISDDTTWKNKKTSVFWLKLVLPDERNPNQKFNSNHDLCPLQKGGAIFKGGKNALHLCVNQLNHQSTKPQQKEGVNLAGLQLTSKSSSRNELWLFWHDL